MNIVITGSSSGIGRHLVAHLCAEQHVVWGLARSPQTDFQAVCTANRQTFHPVICDVMDWSQIERCRTFIGDSDGKIDALICCAGAQAPIGPSMTLNPAAWSRNIRLNLDGTFYCIRAFHDLLKMARRAKVVCFSGGGAAGPRANFSAYACAKTGVVRLVETLAAEWSGLPIDINAVAPGAINTAMTEEVLALGPAVVGEREFAAAEKQKSNGGASLDKVVSLVDFLLAVDSDGITGRLISAPWDPWAGLAHHKQELAGMDIYTLRRILPEDRNLTWGAK